MALLNSHTLLGWKKAQHTRERNMPKPLSLGKSNNSCEYYVTKLKHKIVMSWHPNNCSITKQTSSSIKYFHFLRLKAWWSWMTSLYDVMHTWNAFVLVQPWADQYTNTRPHNHNHTDLLSTYRSRAQTFCCAQDKQHSVHLYSKDSYQTR